MRSVSRELFIMALLLMIVVFMVGMIFYKYMPNNKIVPEPIAYTADSSTTTTLQEIAASRDSVSGSSETKSVIKSYSIGEKDLSAAASKQTYVSGKTDPFAEYVEPKQDPNSTNTVGNTVTGSGATNTVPNSNTNTNKNGSSTGTFFESSSSK